MATLLHVLCGLVMVTMALEHTRDFFSSALFDGMGERLRIIQDQPVPWSNGPRRDPRTAGERHASSISN